MMATSLLHRLRAKVDLLVLRKKLASLQGALQADPSKAILLFASPRGGSTWLEAMLATIPRSATIWEPLDISNVPGFTKAGFWWRQHIPEDSDWPEAKALFEDLFAGRMLSPFLAQSTTPEALADAERLVVKFVRGNLLLPWLVRQFDLPKPVFMVRHPCAVVASMFTHGGWKALPPEPLQLPAHRYDALLRRYLDMVGPIRTLEERYASIWCMSNAYLLDHPLNDRAWTMVTYEDLVLNTENTLEKVFGPWGIPVPEAALDMARRPSRTTRKGSLVQTPLAQLELWRTKLDRGQQDRVLDMVKRFGITLYDRDILPHQHDHQPT